jgi:hypothetical protein
MKLKHLTLFSLSLLLISSCKNENHYLLRQPVEKFSEIEAEETSSKKIARKADQGKFLVRNCKAEFADDNLIIQFMNDTAELIFAPEAAGLPGSWKDFSELAIEVEKEQNYSLKLEISYTGIKNVISDNYPVKKNSKTIIFSLHEIPLAGNNEKTYHPEYISLKFTGELKDKRFRFYKDYVRTWADMSFSLGCHWYQLVDQHVTGRLTNGENQAIRLVDITDQPYDNMVKAISQASDSIYIWHMG